MILMTEDHILNPYVMNSYHNPHNVPSLPQALELLSRSGSHVCMEGQQTSSSAHSSSLEQLAAHVWRETESHGKHK